MTVTTHLSLPAPRTAPADVLRVVREVGERLDIHYGGDDRWLIGEVRPDSPRVHEGRKMLAKLRGDPRASARALRVASLMAGGFSVILEWNGQLDGNAGRIRDEVHRRLTVSERDLEREFERRLDASEGIFGREDMNAKRRDYLAAEGRSLFRKFMRRAVSVVVPSTFRRSVS